jgi:acyl-CoA hydrolase
MSALPAMFREKVVPVEEAVAKIQSDFDIIVAQAASEPQVSMAKFHLVADRVQNVRVFSVLTLNPYPFFTTPDMRGRFEICSWFHSAPARKAIKDGVGTVTFVPNMLHRAAIDRMHVKRPDMFFGTCTPPDRHGYVSLSLGITYERDILENARIVVLEVNPKLPRTYGETQVHIRDVDFFVESDKDPPTLPATKPDEIELTIGEHIAGLVDDGSTLQLGIGGIPNAVAHSLRSKKDLGVHTEMMVDSMMDLYEAGVVTNRRKTLVKDKFIATFAMGSARLYEWLHDNVAVEFRRGAWVNDPAVVRQNSRMVSINTCLMVDLMGQVASESLGPVQYSGTGGQMDTAVGAQEGTDGLGKSIIACRSTAKAGTTSTIVPVLPEGSAVTLHRSCCDNVVTEHGVAMLRGRTLRERARALIAIADPKFREKLTFDATRLGFL